MIWQILGWIVVGLSLVSIVYSGVFHSRNYRRMVWKAENEADEIARQLHERLARRYMWGTIVWQIPKVAVIVIVLNLLL